MATKKRKRRKLRSAVKTYRFIKKHRRRRQKMHPTRRRQETAGILFGIAAIPLLIILGPAAATFAGTAGVMFGTASSGSSPSGSKKRKNVKRNRPLPRMSSRDAIKLKQRRTSCSDACKYSTHDKKTCDCVCGGSSHGQWAWGPSGKTTPNPVRPKRSRTRA